MPDLTYPALYDVMLTDLVCMHDLTPRHGRVLGLLARYAYEDGRVVLTKPIRTEMQETLKVSDKVLTRLIRELITPWKSTGPHHRKFVTKVQGQVFQLHVPLGIEGGEYELVATYCGEQRHLAISVIED